VVDFKPLGGVWSLLLFKCEMTAAGSMAVSNSVLFLTLVCEKLKLNLSTGGFGGDYTSFVFKFVRKSPGWNY
jgi:hypothetical protein